MIIIGIDPGYAITGWAVLKTDNNTISSVDSGTFESPQKELPFRINEIYNSLEKILKKYKPTEAAVEKIYFSKNVKTAIDVAQIRGAIILALTRRKIKISGYTPLQVKQAVAGYGRAEKSQIQSMVKILLHLDAVPQPNDIADAMAVGICHLNSSKFKSMVQDSL